MPRRQPEPQPEPREEPRVVAYDRSVSVDSAHLTLAHLVVLVHEALRHDFPDESRVSVYATYLHGGSRASISVHAPAKKHGFA